MATSMGAMGYSFRTAIVNITGLSMSVPEVGITRMASAMMQEMWHPVETFRSIVGKSAYMANRAKTLHRDIYEVNRNLKGNTKWNSFVSHAFSMIAFIDGLVSRATWLAAYNKTMESNPNEKATIYHADRTVVRTQGSGMKSDRVGRRGYKRSDQGTVADVHLLQRRAEHDEAATHQAQGRTHIEEAVPDEHGIHHHRPGDPRGTDVLQG